MPLTGTAESHDEEDRERGRRISHYIILGITIVIVCCGLLLWLIGDTRQQVDQVKATQAEIQVSQAEAKVRGLKLRAIGCRTVEELGGSFALDDPCTEDEMAPYFAPGRAGE
jgi:hypothetical protein